MQKIVITCEHGGRDIPAEYAGYFSDHEALCWLRIVATILGR
jgi:predicted N-formylglutamate amidohydrolase